MNKASAVLLKFLDNGRNTFVSPELQSELKIDNEQTYRICYHLKERGFIILIGYEKEKPIYALAFEGNEAARRMPVKPKNTETKEPISYSAAFMERLTELKKSVRSTKDMRIAAILTDCLPRGVVTTQDYKNAGFENSWKKDMQLAVQLGLVTKQKKVVSALRGM